MSIDSFKNSGLTIQPQPLSHCYLFLLIYSCFAAGEARLLDKQQLRSEGRWGPGGFVLLAVMQSTAAVTRVSSEARV